LNTAGEEVVITTTYAQTSSSLAVFFIDPSRPNGGVTSFNVSIWNANVQVAVVTTTSSPAVFNLTQTLITAGVSSIPANVTLTVTAIVSPTVNSVASAPFTVLTATVNTVQDFLNLCNRPFQSLAALYGIDQDPANQCSYSQSVASTLFSTIPPALALQSL